MMRPRSISSIRTIRRAATSIKGRLETFVGAQAVRSNIQAGIRSNRNAIRARYLSGRRIAMSLAESAVNSLPAKRMVKNQQMRSSKRRAHLLQQVRAAMMNGNLRQQLREKPQMPALRRSSGQPRHCSKPHDTHLIYQSPSRRHRPQCPRLADPSAIFRRPCATLRRKA
jgi:hypothetical protein